MGNDRAAAVRTGRSRPRAPRRALIALLVFGVGLQAVAAASMPGHVASLNLCTDSLLFELLDDARIASVTALSRDANLSHYHARAAGLRVNHGAVEEILDPRPDVVVTGDNTTLFARDLLERLGIEVLSLPTANTLDDYRHNLRTLAARLGATPRAEQILAVLDRALAAPAAAAAPAPRALLYQPNGFTPGRASLMHDLLRQAGLRNVAAERGLEFGAYLSLEELIAARPDVLVLSVREDTTPSLAEALLDHPALAHLLTAAGATPRRVEVPEALWTCAGAHSAAAVVRLRTAR